MGAPSGKNLFEEFVPVGPDFTLGLGIHQIAGGAAGPLTVTGIKGNAELLAVWSEDATSGIDADLTSEFTVTADNTIDNTGGTDTTGNQVKVFYVNKSD